MARTLQQLKESVENLIKSHGPESPVAAFIFTKLDVYDYDNDDEPVFYNDVITSEVLNNVEENDYIYDKVFVTIEDELRDAKKSLSIDNP